MPRSNATCKPEYTALGHIVLALYFAQFAAMLAPSKVIPRDVIMLLNLYFSQPQGNMMDFFLTLQVIWIAMTSTYSYW